MFYFMTETGKHVINIGSSDWSIFLFMLLVLRLSFGVLQFVNSWFNLFNIFNLLDVVNRDSNSNELDR